MAAREPNDYRVTELREILSARGLRTTGVKADLINRLDEFNPGIWEELNAEQAARDREQNQQQNDAVLPADANAENGGGNGDEERQREEEAQGNREREELLRNAAIRQDDERDPPDVNRVNGQGENDVMRREMDLLRRERDLAQRELELFRRERTANPPSGASSPLNSARSVASTTMSIRAIGELASDYDGGKSFNTWKQQLGLLRDNYRLDENTMRVLISAKLKGRALRWFHSKPEYLTMSIHDLLAEMTAMFDDRPKKLNLRKEFEARIWQKNESFADYYHDKIILGNRVPVEEEEEMIDYLIDGISDDALQNQARMMRFGAKSDLLEAFKKISLDSRKSAVKPRYESKPASTEKKEEAEKRVSRPLKCYNCSEMGHTSRRCPKPRRSAGCYMCNASDHQARDCPRRATPRSTAADGTVEDGRRKSSSGAATPATNVLQIATPSDPYMVKLAYSITDTVGNACNISVNAILDPGSPISLIKSQCVPLELRRPAPLNSNEFFGINNSRLEILGVFERAVKIEDIEIKLVFYIVSDTTISSMALLGRDFTRHSSIKVVLENDNVIISKRVSEAPTDLFKQAVNQILAIDYVNEPFKVNEELNINPEIRHDDKMKIYDIYKNHYLKYLSEKKSEPDFQMIISLQHEQPISFRPRRLSFVDKERLREIIEDLLMRNIIRPSDSPYASPIVLISKKTGETRLCVDYRALNKITVRDNFPTQLIDDNLDRLKGKKYYTSLDLKDGYYHVKIADNSVRYTAFVTPLGQFEYLRCPFGLTNAPKVFSRFLHEVLGKLLREGKILLFFDDILVATEGLEEHIMILTELFEVAGRFHLNFRLDKCKFLYEEIDYLGYRVNHEGIRPSDGNIAAVANYPVPRNAKEAQRFVCLASYFRRFIPHFSIIAKPLYDLARKNARFEFSDAHYEAFKNLKNHLISKPILAVYSPTAETELHCDASITGFGAMLMQKQSDSIFRPVSFFSQRTTPAEAKYHSFELECLAVVYALKRYKIYLMGLKFKIITDCDSFRLTLNKQEINPRISRWAMLLQNFDYEVQHRPGTRMSHVDALSRCHAVLVVESNTFEQTLALCQSRDEGIQKIREELEQRDLPFYELQNGLVYRKDRSKKLLFYVPRSMETNVIRVFHDDLGHLGTEKVINNLTKLYWFPKVHDKVKEHIANCLKCIEFSPVSGKREGFLHSIPKENLPFRTIHIDHMGPLEKSTQGNRHVLVIIDAFTKFVRLYPCKSTTTAEAIRKLKDYFRAYSKPKRMISDRGTAFTSADFKQFTEAEDVQHVLIAVSTPRANGQVERVNRVLTPALAKLAENPKKWDLALVRVEFSLNNTICRSTGEIPSRLLFGVEQIGETNDHLRLILEEMQEPERNLDIIREEAGKMITASQATNEKRFNEKRKEPTDYNVGDYVMVRNVDTTAGINKKLLPKFKGPYEVKKILDYDRYVIGDIDGFQITQIPYTGIFAPEHMKPYVKP